MVQGIVVIQCSLYDLPIENRDTLIKQLDDALLSCSREPSLKMQQILVSILSLFVDSPCREGIRHILSRENFLALFKLLLFMMLE